MKLTTTTLGCPGWSIDEVIEKCSAFGFQGVDFRGLEGNLDVTVLPEFREHISTTKMKLEDFCLDVSGISSSIRICLRESLRENLEEARRTIEVVRALGCDKVRVFGGGDPGVHSYKSLADEGMRTIEEILRLDGAAEINWMLETHDTWIDPDHCSLLLERVSTPAFGILWDIGHTARIGNASHEEIFKKIASRTVYTHVKDAILNPAHPQAMKDGWRYVAPGKGSLRLKDAIALLKSNGYQGWIMFEHEKRWHEELEDPERAFPQFVSWAKPLIKC